MDIYKTPLYDVRTITDLRDMLAQSAAEYGEKAAFLEKKDGAYQPFSFSRFQKDCQALGTALWEAGLAQKRIAIIGDNCYWWCVAYLAVVCGLGVVVPLDKELPDEEILNSLSVAECSAVIYSKSQKERILKISQELPGLTTLIEMYDNDYIKRGEKLLSEGKNDYLTAPINPEAMNVLLFTSGTTGLSKAVMLNHKNICKNLMAMCSMLYIGPKDTFLAVLPLHHTYQCTCGFLCQVYRGCTVAFCEGLRHITDNLAESKTTMMLCVPLILESIYKRIWKQAEKSGQAKKLKFGIALNRVTKAFGVDLSHKLFAQIHETFGGHLRMFISGAAAIDPKICRGLQDLGISVVQGYGLTECSPIAALNRDVYFKNEAAGLPLDGVSIKINQPDENGVGEIYIKGDNVFMGYYENPDETAKVLKDGWFASGDLGYLDRDSFLHITGRKKNVIVTKNGKNVFPEELETYLGRSPYIAESVVSAKFDTRQDDTIVTAQIVPNFEAVEEALGKDYTEQALYDLIKGEVKNVNEKVQIYKRIASFTIRKEEFAKTTTKKIKRYLVKE